jgi:hypothetical protein
MLAAAVQADPALVLEWMALFSVVFVRRENWT